MRRTTWLLLASLAIAAAATSSSRMSADQSVHQVDKQHPLEKVLSGPGGYEALPALGLTLADALTVERKGRIWWDYARDVQSVVRSSLRREVRAD